jgi:aspartate kinase
MSATTARIDHVLKFGGAALADGPAVRRACAIVAREVAAGTRPAVVVSAHEGVTRLLEETAREAAAGRVAIDRVRIRQRSILRQLELDAELCDRFFIDLAAILAAVRERGELLPGERVFVLSFGERMSARVVARALVAHGIGATPVDSFDLGLTTDSNHGQARPLPGIQGAVREALARVPGVPVVTGFLAKDSRGNLTTLGRNGSDLTAALVAEAVGARELAFWKAVGGVMTADPRFVPEARVVERLGWDAAAEYAFHGAEVLHAAALAPARRAGCRVVVRNVLEPDAPGTQLVEEPDAPFGAVGLAHRADVVRLELVLAAPELRGPRLAELLTLLERQRIEPGLFSVEGARVGVYVPRSPALDALTAPRGAEPAPGAGPGIASGLGVTEGLALVAVIGRGAPAEPHAAGATSVDIGLAELAAARVDVIEAFVGRRASQAFVVPRAELPRALAALHAALPRVRERIAAP